MKLMNCVMKTGISPLNFASGNRQMLLLLCTMFTLLLFAVQPAMAAKFINVKTYGAQGDGIANDTNAVQSALDDAVASPGSIVFFPNGTYRTSSILVSSNNTTLLGQSRNNCIFRGTINVSGTGFRLSTMTQRETPNGIQINVANKLSIVNCNFLNSLSFIQNSNDCQIKNCYFENCRILILTCNKFAVLDTKITSDGAGIEYTNSKDVTVRRTRISSTTYGILFQFGERLLVEGCVIQCTSSGASVLLAYSALDTTIRYNVLTGPPSGQQPDFGAFVQTSDNALITGNRIQYVRFGALFEGKRGQVVGNNVSDTSVGVGVFVDPNSTAQVTSNRIRNTHSDGIYCEFSNSGSCAISGNWLKNCGLQSAVAAIYVFGPSSASPTITNNVYTGNQQNIANFIRCFPPSPPAVVKGNFTNTLLPTVVGPP